ncbi:fimbrial protein [Chania multitudinisentens RB-25]|uniref:Fimbrial protein n=1 Tax=Chania multitudinisentens RB-25 TaxID=1441930 RepID=W0LHE1_9GAMM|nr:type 1 fimbrial protein [Chania multitudinisentens]AHG21732.1 fimbrial protein [Chania multitudinisentens RB-25]
MFFNKKAIATLFATSMVGITMNASAAPAAEVTLQGIITNTTCDVTVNGGRATLNIGVFRASDFAAANTQQGSVPLNVTLSNCTADETGNLLIQGVTSTANNDKNLFVNVDSDTVGFMIKNANDVQLAANAPTSLAATEAAPTNYSFQVGMGSTTTVPAAGAYSAPVVVAYIVN